MGTATKRSLSTRLQFAIVVALLGLILTASASLFLWYSSMSPTYLQPVHIVPSGFSFGPSGKVTFELINWHDTNVSIIQVTAESTVPQWSGSVSPTGNNVVPPQSNLNPQANLNLTVQFAGVSWQPSSNYYFTLYDSLGNKIQWAACPSAC